MTSPLRSFLQFAPLERKLRQLAEKSPDWKDHVKAAAGPPLVEYEMTKARQWNRTPPDGSAVTACLNAVVAWDQPPRELRQEDFVRFQALLTGRSGTDFRQGAGIRVTESHACLEPAAIPRALARFFEWTTSQAFAEMHAIEQMALCQLRLYEIWPFEAYSDLAADFFSLGVLYSRTSLLPLMCAGETSEFQQALSEAFGFVTKPLVDFYLRACERTCDEVLRQL